MVLERRIYLRGSICPLLNCCSVCMVKAGERYVLLPVYHHAGALSTQFPDDIRIYFTPLYQP
jgi:hypothetical protein